MQWIGDITMKNETAQDGFKGMSFTDFLQHTLAQDRISLFNAWTDLQKHPPSPSALARLELDLWKKARQSAKIKTSRAEASPTLVYPPDLPISSRKGDILDFIQRYQVVVLAGETGSGKTTQIPKICLEAGRGIEGRIGCTQPRRVAATSIAARLSQETSTPPGTVVGSKIRFSDHTRPETRVKVMTDGILLAELQADPFLWEYDTLIIDEAHERSLNIDFLLGHLRQLLPLRKDLKLIITSATIDTELFSSSFAHAPIIEVSGKLYPVETLYIPVGDAQGEEGEDGDYIQASVQVVETLYTDTPPGDILIFMPGEKDIRETRDLLEGRKLKSTRIVPLFGRLSAQEQQEVFQTGKGRKIVIATNIAETSLTIPGIRWVIDTGLARISRYSPRSRTRRLPIEPVSQSSANQRKGRCGRVSDGVCIRLYSEEDYLNRPEHTQPEIQRCNLAEVILRMKAFNLGDIESFPFLNPPHPQAIRNGYLILKELGALNEEGLLTDTGRQLARLPLDPTIGRMILQSRKEGAVSEVSIIAAGLSIQDPRERPLDQRDAADQMHKRFVHPESDFMTLLNIWNAYHDEWESLKTQNQMRRFCRSHFLSYLRMREWIDVHGQIRDSLKELGGARSHPGQADYGAIHRSILSGLLAYTGHWEETNKYKTGGNRLVDLFPASTLYRKVARNKKSSNKDSHSPKEKKPKQPVWTVAGEIMETSRVFARTVAGIQPEWIADIGKHLCKVQYDTPAWHAKNQRVVVKETTRLHGMVVLERWVDCGKIFPEKANEIFIREALVPFAIQGPGSFMDHNRKVFEKVESLRTRLRDTRFFNLEERLYEFYAARLERVSSVHDLNRIHHIHVRKNPDFLKISETDLVGESAHEVDTDQFPDRVTTPEGAIRIQYAYAPGEDHDGATFSMPLELARRIPSAVLDWMIPGLREEKTLALLKSLPKSYRRELAPVQEKVRDIVNDLQPGHSTLESSIGEFIFKRYGIRIPSEAWKSSDLPAHLRSRYEVQDSKNQTLAAGRALSEINRQLETKQAESHLSFKQEIAHQWERYNINEWNMGDLPEYVEIPTPTGSNLIAWPGLEAEESRVHVRLFFSREEVEKASPAGWKVLAQKVMEKELAWFQKDLACLRNLAPLFVSIEDPLKLPDRIYQTVLDEFFDLTPVLPLTKKRFDTCIRTASESLKGLPYRIQDLLREILEGRQGLLMNPSPYPGLKDELDRLIPKKFPLGIPMKRLEQYPRILKGMKIRLERANTNPTRDREKWERLRPYLEGLEKAADYAQLEPVLQPLHEDLLRCVDEYKISVFAQELGTLFPVSEKLLKNKFEQFRSKRLQCKQFSEPS